MRRVNYGVALFEDPASASNGISAIIGPDDEPIFVPIASQGDLSTDYVWLTNIDLSQYLRRNFQLTPKLRADNYLRTKINSMMIELGFESKTVNENVAAELLRVVNTVADIAAYDIGLTTAPVGTMNNGIRQMVMPQQYPITDHVTLASKSAMQTYVLCEKQASDGKNLSSFVFHRLSHAKNILNSPLPVGKWRKAGDTLKQYPNGAIRAWIQSSHKPYLLKVRIHHIDNPYSQLVNYGAGAGYEQKENVGGETIGFNDRDWMTGHEYLMLSEHAEIEVQDAIEGEGFQTNIIALGDYTQDKNVLSSYAYGIYAENLWTSLGRSLEGGASHSPMSAWVHSIDRSECLKASVKLLKDNWTIHSYGYGRITVEVDPDNYTSMFDTALKHSLVAPMASVDNVVTRPVPQPCSPAQLTQLFMERRAREFMIKNDAAALDRAFKNSMEHEKRMRSGTNLLGI